MKTDINRHPSKTVEFPPWPIFDDDDIAAVSAVLRSGKINRWTGQENILFEKEFAALADCKYAIALANGTVALELALIGLGVVEGDEVIVSSRSFVASASTVAVRGATPVFADIDPVSQNMTAETIEPLVTKRTKAIIAVHLAGWPCEMDAIMDLASHHNLKVVEDCAQAHGAFYKGRPVGSLGHVAAFSFCQDKIMTTGGEGGMLTTNDPEIWQAAWSYKDHGKSYTATMHPQVSHGFRWLHESIGTNWRMTEMQAALGRLALKKLPGWLEIRRSHGAQLTRKFRTISGLRVTVPPSYVEHSYYKYYTFIMPEKINYGFDRETIMQEINQLGVPCGSGACSEIYLEKAFDKYGDLRPKRRLPVAQELGETSLMFLVHPTLKKADIAKTCKVVKEILYKYANN